MKGKRPSDMWHYVQGCIEATVCLSGSLSGYVSDIVKCFNCLPRHPIFVLAAKLGLPSPIVKAWRAGVNALERRFRIRNEIGQATVACTGFAEGDPLSCVAITIMDFCFHLYMSRYAPRCQAISFVDNLELLGHSGSELHHAFLVMEAFLEAWDLEQDPTKSFTWAVDAPTRRLLRGLGHKVALASKDLGSQMNYGGQSRIGVLLDRISSLDRFWTRLRTVAADLRSKLHILRTMAWPRALFGAENLHFSEAHTDNLRSRAMWSLKWSRPGASPLIRMSLMHGVRHDPGFHQVWETLKTVHRHIVAQPEARHWWVIFLSSWNRVSGQGPMRKLFHVFETLGWSLTETGDLVIDGFSRPWLSCPLALLRRLAERSWTQHVCRRLRVRQDFVDLDSIDVNISFSHLVSAGSEAGLLATIQDGTSFSDAFKAKFDPTASANCSICEVPDGLSHRCLECPRFATVRDSFRDCVRLWPARSVAFNQHAVAPEFPQLVQYWQALERVPDTTEDFQVLPEHGQTHHIFSDGTCSNPADADIALGAWAIVSVDLHCVVAAGCLSGILQTVPRAELSAALAALRWGHRAHIELHLWSDSQYVVDGMLMLQTGACIPTRWGNEDLWGAISEQMCMFPGRFQVHKVASHVNLACSSSPFEDWLISGNDMADTPAKAANTGWPETVLRLNRSFSRHKRSYGAAVKRQLAFLLAIAKASQCGVPEQRDDEDVMISSLVTDAVPNALQLASQMPEPCLQDPRLSMCPRDVVRSIAGWIFGLDLAADLQCEVTFLELFFAFKAGEGKDLPVVFSSTGEVLLTSSQDKTVAGGAIAVTLLGAMRAFERIVTAVLLSCGVRFSKGRTSVKHHQVHLIMSSLQVGWPSSAQQLVKAPLDRLSRYSVRVMSDLSKPLCVFL